MTRKEKKNDKSSRLIIVEAVVVLVIVVGIIGFSLYRSASSYVNTSKAVTIDGEKYSVTDVNYFYYAYYNQYCQDYASYIDYMFDNEKSLKDQMYDDSVSWFSYFMDQTIESMVHTVEAAKQADEAGFKLSEASEKEIQDYIEGFQTSAENAGQSADEYISAIYGAGMTMKRYEQLMRMTYTAKEYADEVSTRLAYTDDQVTEYYENNKDSFIYASYERAYIKACDPSDQPTEEEKTAAKNTADQIYAAVENGESLETVAKAYNAVYYATDDAYYSDAYSYGDWLFREDRQAGDKTIIDDGAGYYVMIFNSRGRHDYPTVNIRDIFFKVDKDSLDQTASDYSDQLSQLYEDSCSKAEDIQKAWQDAGGDEASFAKYADENTSTEGLEGGLYEQMTTGTLDTNVDKWCFDSSRKSGDSQIIYTDDGFHLVYFVGEGEPSWKVEVRKAMRTQDTNTWYDSLSKNAKIKRYEKALDTAAASLT